MRDRDELFAALGGSKFRSRFRLGAREVEYVVSVICDWLKVQE